VEPERQWSGDDFEEAHELQRNPYALLNDVQSQQNHPSYDAIIVGGGIAGLAVAYKLRDHNVILLERERETGGVSKSENWNGIEYGIGAAYMINPEPDPDFPDSPDAQNLAFLEELGLHSEGRLANGDENHCVFNNQHVVPHDAVYSRANNEFFLRVLYHDKFPSIPTEDRELVRALDRVSFRQFLLDSELQRKIYRRWTASFNERSIAAPSAPFLAKAGKPSSTTSGAPSEPTVGKPPPITV
jgi:hypothetical protein